LGRARKQSHGQGQKVKKNVKRKLVAFPHIATDWIVFGYECPLTKHQTDFQTYQFGLAHPNNAEGN
jgi:hypothetical protein